MDDTVVSIVLANIALLIAAVLTTPGLNFFFCCCFAGVSQKLIEIIDNRKKTVKQNVNVKYTEA